MGQPPGCPGQADEIDRGVGEYHGCKAPGTHKPNRRDQREWRHREQTRWPLTARVRPEAAVHRPHPIFIDDGRSPSHVCAAVRVAMSLETMHACDSSWSGNSMSTQAPAPSSRTPEERCDP
jgi:hypothetical protein